MLVIMYDPSIFLFCAKILPPVSYHIPFHIIGNVLPFVFNIFSHLQTYAHKILTGRRSLFHTIKQRKGLSGFTSRFESEYDPFGAGHGCNSLSAGLGIYSVASVKC